MSRSNDGLPMLPPWLSESDVSQSGYEAPVQNLPHDDLIEDSPSRRRGRLRNRAPEAERPDAARPEKRRKGWRRDKHEGNAEEEQRQGDASRAPAPVPEEPAPARAPHESWQQPQESWKQPQESRQQPQDSRQQPQDSLQQPQESRQQPPQESLRQQAYEAWQQPQESRQQPYEAWQQPHESWQQSQESRQQPQESRQQPQESWPHPQESQQPQESWQQPGYDRTPPAQDNSWQAPPERTGVPQHSLPTRNPSQPSPGFQPLGSRSANPPAPNEQQAHRSELPPPPRQSADERPAPPGNDEHAPPSHGQSSPGQAVGGRPPLGPQHGGWPSTGNPRLDAALSAVAPSLWPNSAPPNRTIPPIGPSPTGNEATQRGEPRETPPAGPNQSWPTSTSTGREPAAQPPQAGYPAAPPSAPDQAAWQDGHSSTPTSTQPAPQQPIDPATSPPDRSTADHTARQNAQAPTGVPSAPPSAGPTSGGTSAVTGPEDASRQGGHPSAPIATPVSSAWQAPDPLSENAQSPHGEQSGPSADEHAGAPTAARSAEDPVSGRADAVRQAESREATPTGADTGTSSTGASPAEPHSANTTAGVNRSAAAAQALTTSAGAGSEHGSTPSTGDITPSSDAHRTPPITEHPAQAPQTAAPAPTAVIPDGPPPWLAAPRPEQAAAPATDAPRRLPPLPDPPAPHNSASGTAPEAPVQPDSAESVDATRAQRDSSAPASNRAGATDIGPVAARPVAGGGRHRLSAEPNEPSASQPPVGQAPNSDQQPAPQPRPDAAYDAGAPQPHPYASSGVPAGHPTQSAGDQAAGSAPQVPVDQWRNAAAPESGPASPHSVPPHQATGHPAPQWGTPPGYPQPPARQQGAPFQQPSLDDVPLRRAKKAPGTGWRKAVHHVSGGAINPGMSAEERRLQELVARIRQPVRGDYRIAVLSLKGGVGKTTTTMGLGSTFASIRGDRVIAVDANPDFGTLSQRVPLQTRSTVRDLLLDSTIQRYSDVRRHTSQATSRLEVLASERDPAASEAFSEEEYRAVARILQRFYNIILTDCGTGLMHSAMSGVLDLAHSLVLISSPAIDGARSAAATLDWLSLHGHDHLVRNAVVVINSPRAGSPNVGIQQLREYFLSRCRAVHIIPFDAHMSEGAEIDLHRLHKQTKRAYVELAATVADDFATDHRRYHP
ncbi:AAA family ATPase [Nocardia sp. NPDC059691]|uniref:nucleotide-binding protein n=1 Tax=unclassified Nocardia TaxID=2637762 RepID=UPI0036BA1E8A